MRCAVVVAVVFCCVCGAGCDRAAPPRVLLDGERESPWAGIDGDHAAFDVDFDGRVKLLGARLTPAQGAEPAHLIFWWHVERDLTGRTPRIFVHARAAGAEVNQAQADHDLPGLADLRAGDVVVDRVDLVVPGGVSANKDGSLDLFVGLFEGDVRWTTTPAAPKNAVRVGSIAVAGVPPVEVDVPAASGVIVVDGVFDEPAWATAAVLPLRHHLGKQTAQLATTAKMLWTADALYLAFVAADPDPFSPYNNRDDPLYDGEAYELFIDADGDGDEADGEYVELQANIRDVHFDSAFAGGRRKHMDVAFDHPFVTRTVIENGEVHQEWKIPVAGLRGIPVGEPRAGASWRVNVFRLERRRRGEKVVAHEASAWSPPLSNDFHNLARLGTVHFR